MEIVETINTVIGFADAISYIIRYIKAFVELILPNNIAVMFGIAFTVIIALSIKRSVVS